MTGYEEYALAVAARARSNLAKFKADRPRLTVPKAVGHLGRLAVNAEELAALVEGLVRRGRHARTGAHAAGNGGPS